MTEPQPESVPDTLALTDLPGLFQAADAASGLGQRTFFRSTSLRLGLAVLAAISGAVSIRVGSRGGDVAAAVTSLAFVGVLVVDVFDLQARPGVGWYEGRALAESVKTLSWRFAVGGAPFPVTLEPGLAERLFLNRLAELLRDLPAVVTAPSLAPAISATMRRLRATELADRQLAYLSGRIADQQKWYADRAVQHARRARQLQIAGLLLEVVGVAAALGEFVHLFSFDLAGIVAAMIAAIAAWAAGKQYGANAAAYSLAGHELAIIHTRLDQPLTEPEWSNQVADAEDAVSREHTTWRASHRH
ncbi:MAG TPA: DUF4231 domain-containing protein [Pseudonocardiaceae bacterium]|jgi:hypothetical protein|nr:DUF4231 domain-containing protein [Pseudonocardiaceae bacterium]